MGSALLLQNTGGYSSKAATRQQAPITTANIKDNNKDSYKEMKSLLAKYNQVNTEIQNSAENLKQIEYQSIPANQIRRSESKQNKKKNRDKNMSIGSS
jgi:hypothetical protein